jgi:hypothetical protein
MKVGGSAISSDGIKATWNNIFSQLAENFPEGSLAGDCPYG